VQPASAAPASTGPLRREHVEFLAQSLEDCVVAGVSTHEVSVRGEAQQVRVVATDATLQQIRQWPVRAGRFLDAADIQDKSRHAVLSRALSDVGGRHVGDTITLRNVPFRVVGVVEVGGGALEGETSDPALIVGERVVFIPSSTPPYWLPDGALRTPLDSIFVRVGAAANLERALALAQRLLGQPDQCLSGLSWVTPDALLHRVRSLQTTIKLTVGSIAILCLILGGTTLMSLMVANVRDRVVEIGLRRALGATRQDIAILFVIEGCLITTAAALAGTVVTHALLLIGRERLPVPVNLGAGTFLAPMVVAIVVGTAFSYWPARFAARIVPSEALRNE